MNQVTFRYEVVLTAPAGAIADGEDLDLALEDTAVGLRQTIQDDLRTVGIDWPVFVEGVSVVEAVQ